MNSLNIISSHVSPPASSSPTRSNSISAFGITVTSDVDNTRSGGSSASNAGSSALGNDASNDTFSAASERTNGSRRPSAASTNTMVFSDRYYEGAGRGRGESNAKKEPAAGDTIGETTPLLSQKDTYDFDGSAASLKAAKATWASLPNRIAIAVWQSIRWVLQTLAAPGVYFVSCFYDTNGNFTPIAQLKLLFGQPQPSEKKGPKKISDTFYDEPDAFVADDEKLRRLSTESDDSVVGNWTERGRPFFADSTLPNNSYAVSSESESEIERKVGTGRSTGGGIGSGAGGAGGSGGRAGGSGSRRKGAGADGTGRRGTGGSRSGGDEDSAGGTAGTRRSVRIKLNDDTLRQRKQRKGTASSSGSLRGSSGSGSYGGGDNVKDILAQLKSPTSPAGALTKYPRAPVPPRPLIPRRYPSYLNLDQVDRAHQKTLILDLDETLIHSMSKGGRMSTGHMVEVRLNTAFVGMGGQATVGPQHPILYYVHKRPYCDEFLRRVSKWYNLVVFTASVQEYADPVIDWLESERKFFSARYYRQHCTFRHGAFIKDLSAVEPDLSKVMILDNSPLSYMFHQDNAIPIQGWISDHTDSDLLHLVPLLEGLQYVSDVRALLALRGGEDGMHMA